MPRIQGIAPLYYEFTKYLGLPEVRDRVAPLQLVGRMEDYLVKEFARYILRASDGRRFVESNSGRRGEQKVDLVVLRAAADGGEILEALVEAKYFRNRHRRSSHCTDAMDEIRGSLRSLQSQLRLRPVTVHGTHPVKLRARRFRVYGLVFASYARLSSEPNRKPDFFARVLREAQEFGLRYHDLPKPYFRHAYEDIPVDALGARWLVTLRVGLWRGVDERAA